MKTAIFAVVVAFAAFKGFDVLAAKTTTSAVAETMKTHHERLASAGE